MNIGYFVYQVTIGKVFATLLRQAAKRLTIGGDQILGIFDCCSPQFEKEQIMVLRLFTGAAFATFLMIVGWQDNAIAQQSFPLICQTGGNMKLIVTPRRDVTRVEIRFTKASTGASARRPGPGECAWFDRPLNSAEPTLVAFEMQARIWTEFNAVGVGGVNVGVVSSGASGEFFAQTFLNTVRGSGCFTINARNSNSGYLIGAPFIEGGC